MDSVDRQVTLGEATILRMGQQRFYKIYNLKIKDIWKVNFSPLDTMAAISQTIYSVAFL